MPDLFSPRLTTDTAAQDAEVLRDAARRVRAPFTSLFPGTDNFLFGSGPVARRLDRANSNLTGEAAEFAGFKGLVSAPAKRAVAKYFAGILEGVEAEEATAGETLEKIFEAVTELPDPAQFGVARNAYLPSGVTDFIPGAGRLRLIGFPEQYAADREAARQRLEGAMQRRSTEELTDLITQRTSLARSLRIDARINPRFTQEEFLDAARLELQRRAQGAQAATGALAPGAAGTGAAPGAALSPLDPFGVPVAGGSLQPEAIKPVNDKAIENQRQAKGIRRELVHERADP